ncbi:hypothetical protein CXT87_01585 [Akkermansia muciniphila]|nr:hypothetical protein [Akkermansia muciniphila]PNC84036.1 hypothetical protein CXT93_07390 [Akkermansia muciniphila]PND01827.1 hypothetical protein CXT87_01585 [Akkermansia muciniphila]PND04432.1 hypothetical protein CXT86_06690 [Akkermansia muciniphila]PND10225.1 hypothetical protein CXT85_05540 [Akkermansia muciniphila]
MSDKRGFFVPPEWIRSFYPPLIQEKIRELSPPLRPNRKKRVPAFFRKKRFLQAFVPEEALF